MKFRTKMTLSMICLISLVFGVCGSMLISISFRDSLEREEDNAFRSYKMVLNTLQVVNRVQKQNDRSDISDTLEQLATQSTVAWTALRLTTQDGEIIYENGVQTGALSATAPQIAAQPDTEHYNVSHRHSPSGNWYMQLSGVFTAGQEQLYLEIAHDVSVIYFTRDLQVEAYRRMFYAMVLLCAGLSYLTSWVLTRPLSRLSKASRELAMGNLAYRSTVRTNDEVGALSDDFNKMAQTLEENINELTAAMERQEDFMGNFAHEMKNPMTSIIGYADLIRSHVLDNDEKADAASYILSEAKRLESLSLKLLEIIVLKKEQLELVPQNLARIIYSLGHHLQPIYKQWGITLRFSCADGMCLMEPDLVASLLVNLLDNARKALDGGGEIYLVGEMLPNGCRIRVMDNGKGIPPEALEHLMDAFYRVDKSRSRAQGGVGLGLSLCNRIVELHNGNIHFDSEEGRWTVVTVDLLGGRA